MTDPTPAGQPAEAAQEHVRCYCVDEPGDEICPVHTPEWYPAGSAEASAPDAPNAEDCPRCMAPDAPALAYPFICPGHDDTPPAPSAAPLAADQPPAGGTGTTEPHKAAEGVKGRSLRTLKDQHDQLWFELTTDGFFARADSREGAKKHALRNGVEGLVQEADLDGPLADVTDLLAERAALTENAQPLAPVVPDDPEWDVLVGDLGGDGSGDQLAKYDRDACLYTIYGDLPRTWGQLWRYACEHGYVIRKVSHERGAVIGADAELEQLRGEVQRLQYALAVMQVWEQRAGQATDRADKALILAEAALNGWAQTTGAVNPETDRHRGWYEQITQLSARLAELRAAAPGAVTPLLAAVPAPAQGADPTGPQETADGESGRLRADIAEALAAEMAFDYHRDGLRREGKALDAYRARLAELRTEDWSKQDAAWEGFSHGGSSLTEVAPGLHDGPTAPHPTSTGDIGKDRTDG